MHSFPFFIFILVVCVFFFLFVVVFPVYCWYIFLLDVCDDCESHERNSKMMVFLYRDMIIVFDIVDVIFLSGFLLLFFFYFCHSLISFCSMCVSVTVCSILCKFFLCFFLGIKLTYLYPVDKYEHITYLYLI